jgi:DNA adenine methylase
MRYIGGKSRQSRDFVPAILQHTPFRDRLIEPFVGGGAMLGALAPHFHSVMAGDGHLDLALMWRDLANGWLPPTELTEAEYQSLRHQAPSALRGFAGFGCSFGGKWFGGYHHPDKRWPRNIASVTGDNLRKIVASLPDKRLFLHQDYRWWTPGPGDVVYADPPYRGGSTFAGLESFDHDEFWDVAAHWSKSGAHVFVSEYTAPDGWEPLVVSQQRKLLQGTTLQVQHDALWMLASESKVW